MKLSLSASDLADAVTAVLGAVDSNIAAYTGLVLQTRTSKAVQVYSLGQSVTLALTVPAEVAEEGNVFIQGDALKRYLTKLPGATTLSLSVNDQELHVAPEGMGNYKFKLLAVAPPPLPISRAQLVDIEPDTLSTAVRSVKHASKATTLLESADETLTLTTTDSYRGARAVVEGAGFGDYVLAVGNEAIAAVAGCPFTSLGVVGKNRELRALGDTALVSVRLQNETPNPLPAGIWTKPSHTTVLDISEVLKALGRLGGLVGRAEASDSWAVSLKFNAKTLTLSVSNPEIGDGVERVQLEEGASEFECLLSIQYFEESLKAHLQQTAEVRVGWQTPERPMWFHSSERFDLTTIVMPAI